MYLPEHFAEVDVREVSQIIESGPLACIVAQTETGLVANHIPLFAGPDGDLIGHIALANDLHRLLDFGHEVLAIFQGDDAYVSPNFYPGKTDHHRVVPTWNYQVVHVHGTISFQHDVVSKHRAVALLTRMHERRLNGDEAWQMRDAPQDFVDDMLANIVALRISVSRTVAKSKLSQNRDARDYIGAIDGLRASGQGNMADRMAQKMRESS
ncbi:MAG: FMN-binding negative transcriptional regulator [Pseudomonadota bacterium]